MKVLGILHNIRKQAAFTDNGDDTETYVPLANRGWFDHRETPTSFFIGIDQETYPPGYADRVYISETNINSESDGELYTTLTTQTTEIQITGLKSCHQYHVRIYRYVNGVYDSVSNCDYVYTLAKELSFSSARDFVEDFSTGSFFDRWEIVTSPYEISNNIAPKIIQNDPVFGSALRMTDEERVDSPGALQAWTSRETFQLVPPFTLETRFRLSGYSPPQVTYGLCLYNGEGYYSGLYCIRGYAGYDGRFDILSNMFQDEHGQLINQRISPPVASPYKPFLSYQTYTMTYDVAADGEVKIYINGLDLTHLITDTQEATKVYHKRFLGPTCIWFMYGGSTNVADVHVDYIRLTNARSQRSIVGSFNGQNMYKLQPTMTAQPGYDGFYLYDGHLEFYPTSTRCLTARFNENALASLGDIPIMSWSALRGMFRNNEGAYENYYVTGPFNGRLWDVSLPQGSKWATLEMQGRQGAGYLKIRVYDADTMQIIPDSELPGNSDGFTPDGVVMANLFPETTQQFQTNPPTIDYAVAYGVTAVDLSNITATKITFEIDGYYDGSSVAAVSYNNIDYTPSTLYGLAVSIVTEEGIKNLNGTTGTLKKLNGQPAGTIKRYINATWQ